MRIIGRGGRNVRMGGKRQTCGTNLLTPQTVIKNVTNRGQKMAPFDPSRNPYEFQTFSSLSHTLLVPPYQCLYIVKTRDIYRGIIRKMTGEL